MDGVQLQTVGCRSFEDRAHQQRCGRGWGAEKELEAMGDEGPVVEVLKSELTKAKSASKQPPLDVEIDQWRKYVATGERRIKQLDSQRAEECALLTEAQERLKRLVNAQSRANGSPSRIRGGYVTPANGEHVANRARHSCEGAARSQMRGPTIKTFVLWRRNKPFRGRQQVHDAIFGARSP